MAYFIYSIIYVMLFFLAQLPSDYRIEVDVEAVCCSITFEDKGGDRIPIPDWILGPGKRTNCSVEDQNALRLATAKNWIKHQERDSSVLPVVHVHGALNRDSGICAF
jgi:hypothetical protein